MSKPGRAFASKRHPASSHSFATMRVFVIAFGLWLALPALLCWALSSPPLLAVLSSASLLFLLPLAVCCFVADRSLYPPWYRPGVQPKKGGQQRGRNASASSTSRASGKINPAVAAWPEPARPDQSNGKATILKKTPSTSLFICRPLTS